jgi:adenosylcobinamide-GDP ribazoletransferase
VLSLDDLRIALMYFTRLPGLRVSASRADDLSRAAPWLPLVGLVIGAAVAFALWAGAHVAPSIAALLGLFVWVVITGGLHLDGLGDVADALAASHRSPDRFLEVVHDPRIGAFGVMAIALQLLAKLVLLGEISGVASLAALVLVPVWSRWGALVLSLAVPSLAPGAGERFSERIGVKVVAGEALALGIVSIWLAPALLGAFLIVPAMAAYWRHRLGGINGDCLGASIEVSETLLLFLLAVWVA